GGEGGGGGGDWVRDGGPGLVADRVIGVAVLVAELRRRSRRDLDLVERHARRDVGLQRAPRRRLRLQERKPEHHVERDADDVDVDAAGGTPLTAATGAGRNTAVDVELLRADGRPEREQVHAEPEKR